MSDEHQESSTSPEPPAPELSPGHSPLVTEDRDLIVVQSFPQALVLWDAPRVWLSPVTTGPALAQMTAATSQAGLCFPRSQPFCIPDQTAGGLSLATAGSRPQTGQSRLHPCGRGVQGAFCGPCSPPHPPRFHSLGASITTCVSDCLHDPNLPGTISCVWLVSSVRGHDPRANTWLLCPGPCAPGLLGLRTWCFCMCPCWPWRDARLRPASAIHWSCLQAAWTTLCP